MEDQAAVITVVTRAVDTVVELLLATPEVVQAKEGTAVEAMEDQAVQATVDIPERHR